MELRKPLLISLLLTFSGAVSLADPATPQSDAGAGFIYATVAWPSGTEKTGFLRWKDEEAYWEDLFHCGYRHIVWSDYVDLETLRKERRAEYYKKHGLFNRLKYALGEDKDDPVGFRVFCSSFGDLQSIEIHDGKDDFAVTADGARHQIGGYANDAGSRLFLYVEGEEREQIVWNDLSEIRFEQAPADAKPYARRLYGTVETSRETYEGFIQWDRSECATTDVLDGKEDGREKDLEMGEIRSITRRRDNSVDVVTKEGVEHHLTGSNDVGSGNRDVMVRVADVGWVGVPWNRFKSVTFVDGQGSGPGRDAFDGAAPLRGAVVDADGRRLSGRLVFDLDEAFHWDLFNGKDAQGFTYDIPVTNIQRLEPGKDDKCRVTLRNGTVLVLGDSQDTGESNGGLIVFANEAVDPEHIAWRQVRDIEFWW